MPDNPVTLLVNGRIHSPHAPDATAMAVIDGTVTWLGQDAAAHILYPQADRIDLDGAFVTPGFVDAHVHATATGLHLTGVDLSPARSAADLLSLVAQAARTVRRGHMLIAHGWDESTWSDPRLPSRAELDDIAGDLPVYLSRIDAHSALVSTALTEQDLAIPESTGWSPEGPLTREAHHRVRAVMRNAMTSSQRQQAQEAFLSAAASNGIVSVHECSGPDIAGETDLAELFALADKHRPDIIGYWGEPEAIDTAHRLGVTGLAGDVFVDGSLGSRTAALNASYADAPSRTGTLYLDTDKIAEHIITCTEAQLQAGFHAIGDRAITAVIAGFQQAERRLGRRALINARHRLEHLDLINPTQATELSKWAVAVSVQPQSDALWGGANGMYAARLGTEKALATNPLAALASAGLVLAFGSDAPVTDLNPWKTIQAATHPHNPTSALTSRAAFNAHTKGGYRAAGISDGITGTLVPGAPAHYAIWEAGPLVAPSSDARIHRWSTDPRSRIPPLPNLSPEGELPRCIATVRAGTVIYERASARNTVGK